jgi:hypothetical protein
MNEGRLRARAVAAVMCVGLLLPSEGRAATGQVTVSLEYSAVPDCPDVSYFKAIVVERLGADAFAETAPKRVLVQITSRDQTFEGRMEWLDAEGNWAGDRTFPARSSDCEDLVRAMAFTLALQIQFSALSSAPPSTSTPSAETKRASQTPSSPPAPPVRNTPAIDQHKPPAQASEPTPSARLRPVFAVGAGALVGFGMSSSAVPIARIFGSVARAHWSLELAAEASLPTTIRRADRAGFSHQEVLASVAGCGTLQAWSACLLAKAGEIWITGKDIDVPSSARGPILETGVRVSATQRIFRRVYASAHADFLVLPINWQVTLDHTVVWTSPRFAETIGLDVALRF